MRLLVALAMLVGLASCPLALAMEGEGAPLRVVSLNLRGDFDEGIATDKPHAWLSTDGEHRRDVSLALIGTLDADLLGVQEAYANQLSDLRSALPTHADEGVGRDDGRSAGEHCSIFYRKQRFERVRGGTFWLSATPDAPSKHPDAACPRIATWLVLADRAADRQVLVLNTHWDHVSAEARVDAATQIRSWLEEADAGLPTIVMGDLNANEGSQPVLALRASPSSGQSSEQSIGALLDSYRQAARDPGADERSYHGYQGGDQGKRIDFILHNDAFETLSASVVRDKINGRYASDHYPVVATLRYKRDESSAR